MTVQPISKDRIYNLLQGCAVKKDLTAVRKVHSLIVESGLDLIAPLVDHLIRLFGSSGSLPDASRVFSRASKPSIFTWNSMISAHVKLDEGLEALQLFEKLQQYGILPDRVTFVCLCKACGIAGSLFYIRQVHDMIIADGKESQCVLANTIIDMYAKCGSLTEAHRVFNLLLIRDLVSWTVIISGYAAHGQGKYALELYQEMCEESVKPNDCVLLCMLKACCGIGSVVHGSLMHGEIIEMALESTLAVMSCLVEMYAKCGSLEDANKVFESLPSRDVVSWGVMIDSYAQHGYGLVALEIFSKMQEEGIEPNSVIFLSVLKACGSLHAIMHGRFFHAEIIRRRFESDDLIGSALVDMYVKCGSLEEAHKVFEGQANHNIVSWGAMMTGLCELGHAVPALEFFNAMQQDAIQPNRVLYLCALKACCSSEALEQGMLIHDQVAQSSFGLDLTLGNTIVDMYAKCGRVEDAQRVFDSLQNRDVISWAVMISGYYHQGCNAIALDLFARMQLECIRPNRAIFLCVLRVCRSIGIITFGQLIHDQINSHFLESDHMIRNTLVDLYANCGKLEDACNIFDGIANKDMVSCGAIIAGHAHQGDFKAARKLLLDMHRSGLKPDGSIFTSILSSCSNVGLRREGCEFFKSMVDEHDIIPEVEHYSCLIDLLGRGGEFGLAEDLLASMPMLPDFIMWISLISSCKTYNNVELGKHCLDQVMHLDPIDSSGYLLMSNLYADAHSWEDICELQHLRKCAGALKEPARAWIELTNGAHEFLVGGQQTHAYVPLLQEKIVRLSSFMKGQGLVPQLNLVFSE